MALVTNDCPKEKGNVSGIKLPLVRTIRNFLFGASGPHVSVMAEDIKRLNRLSKRLKENSPTILANDKRASVAIILRLHNRPISDGGTGSQELQILFIKRARRIGDRWSGDIAFPGGKHDFNLDRNDDYRTAVRETKEEIGLDLDMAHDFGLGSFKLLGRLNDRPVWNWNNRSMLLVLCTYVFIYTAPPSMYGDINSGTEFPEFSINYKEVETVLWVPVSLFDRYLLYPSLLIKNAHIFPLIEMSKFRRRLIEREKQGSGISKSLGILLDWLTGCVYFPAVNLPLLENSSTSTESLSIDAPLSHDIAFQAQSAFFNSKYPTISRYNNNGDFCKLWGLSFSVVSDFLDLVHEPGMEMRSLNSTPMKFDFIDVNLFLKLFYTIYYPNSVGKFREELMVHKASPPFYATWMAVIFRLGLLMKISSLRNHSNKL